jgi:FAD/FMN-containing dehydrogenase
VRSGRRATRRSAPRSGSVASARSAPSAGWRPTTARRTASCRARACRTSCGASRPAAERHRLRIGNVFHAGDGNIHPIILFDERDRDETARVLAAGREILEACVELGGSITGEHGIGVEKMAQLPLLFGPDDLRAMMALRAVFDPEHRANPHKVFPDAKVCVEARAPRRQAPL